MSKLTSILAAIDSSGSARLLKAAAELASRAHAELKALHVEDAEWYEASKFNFSHQVSSYTGKVSPLTEKDISQQSRALGSMLQNVFSDVSASKKIQYSYQSVRGNISSELIKAMEHADLLIIGRGVRPFKGTKKLGGTARYVADHSEKPVLIWSGDPKWPDEFIGLCINAEQSIEVLSWTAALGKLLNRKIRLFWRSKTFMSERWLDQFEEEETPELADIIRDSSELRPYLTADILKYNQRQLFVIQRRDLEISPSEIVEDLPNAVLLL